MTQARQGSSKVRRRAAARGVAWGLVALALVVGVVGAVNRGVKGRPDWGDLQRESQHVWEHGHTAPGTAMFGYLPPASFALWPFTAWLPQPWGVLAFILTNIAAAVLSVWIVYRWWLGPHGSAAVLVWPLLLASVNLAHALQANQLTLWTLVACVGGLTLVGRGRQVTGGLVIGLAAVLKVIPAILVGYLLLRRRWKALLGFGLAVVLFDVVPCVVVFGWDGMVEEHRAWVRRARWHGNWHWIDQPLLRVHRHGSNFSLSVVLGRWLRETPDARRQVILYGDPPAEVVERYRAGLEPEEMLMLDPMPPGEEAWAEKRVDISWVPRFSLAALPARGVWGIWVVLVGGGLAALAWLTWRSGRGNAHADWVPISALWMLAMFWPSPMTRHYYLAWAFPALVMVWQGLAAARERGGRWRAGDSLALASLIAWMIGIACLGQGVMRWYGVHLAVLAVLAAATVWVLRQKRRSDVVG
jgi:hypothetical protein